jgi:hypothetical protein
VRKGAGTGCKRVSAETAAGLGKRIDAEYISATLKINASHESPDENLDANRVLAGTGRDFCRPAITPPVLCAVSPAALTGSQLNVSFP